MRTKLPLCCLIFYFFISIRTSVSQKLEIKSYVTGINQPIDIKNCGDDRLFIADRAGRIRIISSDTLNAVPFLNITSKISSTSSEEGFLGIAFSPDYKISRKFYVNYTANIGSQLTTIIEEYTTSPADSNVADPASALIILSQAQPFSNHNGGNMMFGPDGYLYINFGDGGSGGDPAGNGQNADTLLGKILRIDVSNSSVASRYLIPPSNPFSASAPPVKKEIWAFGVRNPWRSSFDRITGDLWIADVGQSKVEEIDFQAAGIAGGRNYGWNIVEGDSCYSPSNGCNKTGITMPVYEYFHNGFSQSITGGYVYRSVQSKSLFGMYIFGDYIQEFIDGFILNGSGTGGSITHLLTAVQIIRNPISFGEDRYGDMYVVFGGINTVFKMQDSSTTRRPKAFFTPVLQGNGTYLLTGLQGRNVGYKWLKDGNVIPGAIDPDFIVSTVGTYSLVLTNSIGFSDTSAVFAFGALHVGLKNFSATRRSSVIAEVEWQTASDQNIRSFAIQRKMNNESIFLNIAIVQKGATIPGRQGQYLFIDSGASANSIFYRLEIRNIDGSVTYSDIRFISGIGFKQFLLYPNPVRGQINFSLSTQSPVELIIYDYAGRKVKQQKLAQQTGMISLFGLSGIYFFSLSENGIELGKQKIVVQ
ncbi:MAG: PQQ-dependent sugar dehydrogenase [Ginsengibacter sp.]